MAVEKNEKEDLINRLTIRLLSEDTSSVKDIKELLTEELYDYSVEPIDSTELSTADGSTTKYLLDYYCISKMSANINKDSLEQYTRAVYQLVNLTGKELNLITADDVKVFLIKYKQLHKCSDVTMNSKRLYLSSVFNFLYQNKKIEVNPMAGIQAIKCRSTVKDPLNDEEVEKIRVVCENEKNKKKGLRDLAIINFFIDTGVRVSEGSNITLEDIDWTKNRVKVLGKGNKERWVYFSDRTKIRCMEYLKTRDDVYDANSGFIKNVIPIGTPLFATVRKPYKKIGKESYEKMMRQIGIAAGVERLHPHLLRATFASNLFRKGVDVKLIAEALGHANLNTVNRYCIVKEDTKGNILRGAMIL